MCARLEIRKHKFKGRHILLLFKQERKKENATSKNDYISRRKELEGKKEKEIVLTVVTLDICPKVAIQLNLSKTATLKKTKTGFQDQFSLNGGQKYCRMLQVEHSAILSTFIKLPFVIKIFFCLF